MWPFKRREYDPVQIIEHKSVRFTFAGDYVCRRCTTTVRVTDAMHIKTHDELPYPVWWSVKCPSCGASIEVERQKIIEPQEEA